MGRVLAIQSLRSQLLATWDPHTGPNLQEFDFVEEGNRGKSLDWGRRLPDSSAWLHAASYGDSEGSLYFLCKVASK